jgi:hypothetical protein
MTWLLALGIMPADELRIVHVRALSLAATFGEVQGLVRSLDKKILI